MGFKKTIELLLPKILYLGTILMFLSPIIPRGIRPIFIALYIGFSIYSGIVDKFTFRWRYLLLNSSLFIIYLISLIYTEDLPYGLRKISSSLSLLAFPLAYSSMSNRCLKFILDRRFNLMWYFIIATITLCIGAFIKFYIQYSFDQVITHYVNIIRTDLLGWKINPIYLSMHICVSIIFSMFIFNNGVKLSKLLCLILINLFLVGFLLLLIKKGPLIALVLVSGFLVLMFKNKTLYFLYFAGALSLAATIIYVPKVNARFSELLQVQDADESLTNSTNIRYSIYQCVLEIIPEAGVLGYGIGDGKNELIDCYEDNIAFLADHKYNSHNQFLGIILKVGYLGLFVFVVFLLFHLIRGFNRKNYLLIALLLYYVIVMFSENILERENGVLFFSLFINLFLMADVDLERKVKTSHSEIIKPA